MKSECWIRRKWPWLWVPARKPLPVHSSGADADLGLNDVVALTPWIALGMKEDGDSVPHVVLQQAPDDGEGCQSRDAVIVR